MATTRKVFLGFAQPRRGREMAILPTDAGRDLIAKAYLAFNLATSERYTLVAADREQTILGDFEDAALLPLEILRQLDEAAISHDLVVLPADVVRELTADADAVDDADADDEPNDGAAADEAGGARGATALADRLAKRIARLAEYVDVRADAAQHDAHVARKVARARADIEALVRELVHVESEIFEAADAGGAVGGSGLSPVVPTRGDRVRSPPPPPLALGGGRSSSQLQQQSPPLERTGRVSSASASTRSKSRGRRKTSSKQSDSPSSPGGRAARRRRADGVDDEYDDGYDDNDDEPTPRIARYSSSATDSVLTGGSGASSSSAGSTGGGGSGGGGFGHGSDWFECDMCGKPTRRSETRPRWVFVPSATLGSACLNVCSACAGTAKATPGARAISGIDDARRLLLRTNVVQIDDDTAAGEADSLAYHGATVDKSRVAFHFQDLGRIGPSSATTYERLGVPRFFDAPIRAFAGVVLLPPDVLVARYRNVGTLYVCSVQRTGGVVVSNESPLLSLRVVPPYVLSFHENDTLQLFSADGHGSDVCRLDCSQAFATDTSARSRTLIANARWVLVASRRRLCVWPWRVALQALTANTPPDRTIELLDTGDIPREEFCQLDGQHLLLGSNHTLAVYDVLHAACLYFFSLRDQSDAPTSFYAMRFTGECVVTQQSAGLRVWRVFGRDAPLDARAPPPPTPLLPPLPPLVQAAGEPGTSVSSFYADRDVLLLGTSTGRVRLCWLGQRQEPRGSSGRPTAAPQLDEAGVEIEYLNSRDWAAAAPAAPAASGDKAAAANAAAAAAAVGLSSAALSSLQSISAQMERAASARALAERSPMLRRASSRTDCKVSFIDRDGERVFVAQNNGVCSSWQLLRRDARAPEHTHKCARPIRHFAQRSGTLVFAFRSEEEEEARSTSSSSLAAADADADAEFIGLSVVVWHCGAPRPRLPVLAAPMPPLERLRAVVFYAVDDAAPADGILSALHAQFKAVAARAAAQGVYFVPYSAVENGTTGDALASTSSVNAALSPLLPRAVPPAWLDASLTAPDARYGLTVTPARLWAHVSKHLLATTATLQATSSDRKKKGGALATLFSKRK